MPAKADSSRLVLDWDGTATMVDTLWLVLEQFGDYGVFRGAGERLMRGELITSPRLKNSKIPKAISDIILRALGQQKVVDVEVNELAPEPGDVFLLCSDGLSGMVTDEMMQAILQKANGLDAAAKKLIDTANANGGINNLTVILAQYLPS